MVQEKTKTSSSAVESASQSSVWNAETHGMLELLVSHQRYLWIRPPRNVLDARLPSPTIRNMVAITSSVLLVPLIFVTSVCESTALAVARCSVLLVATVLSVLIAAKASRALMLDLKQKKKS